jgi:transcriptional regulator with XRE-family HTH domain
MPRPKESFESRMKKLRLKTGLSLKQLANETGYSSEYLKKIEKGQVIPPVSAIIQIAKALSVESGREGKRAFLSGPRHMPIKPLLQVPKPRI